VVQVRRRTPITIKSFTFVTEEGGAVFVDIASALASPVDDEIDGMMLQIPVFCDDRAGYIYVTPSEVANVGRTLLFEEATLWSKKSERRERRQ
jgi:hypothetical protein